jgi:peptidoglycan/xylan/chitin deacetylase (PgdA/CDA1 family)
MNIDQIRHLQSNNMYIGNHGYSHCWLSHLNDIEMKSEIDLSLKFLKSLGVNLESWIMCYPYGNYNNSLLNLLENSGCALGLTTNVGIASLDKDNPLTLPRLDTNDFPRNSNNPPNKWTKQAMG